MWGREHTYSDFGSPAPARLPSPAVSLRSDCPGRRRLKGPASLLARGKPFSREAGQQGVWTSGILLVPCMWGAPALRTGRSALGRTFMELARPRASLSLPRFLPPAPWLPGLLFCVSHQEQPSQWGSQNQHGAVCLHVPRFQAGASPVSSSCGEEPLV